MFVSILFCKEKIRNVRVETLFDGAQGRNRTGTA